MGWSQGGEVKSGATVKSGDNGGRAFQARFDSEPIAAVCQHGTIYGDNGAVESLHIASAPFDNVTMRQVC
jgi:hypothetical protein